MTVEEILLLKTGFFELSPQLALAVEEVERYICSYCGLGSVPADLNGLWADLALAYAEEAEEDRDAKGLLASITMGDASYTFDNDKRTILAAYRERLNRYRRGLFL